MPRPIIVFDSGRGGETIFTPLKQALPKANLIYRDDRANFPYGSKSSAWLSARFKELGHEFSALNPQLVVLACNTATVNVISELRQQLSCPVIGVEPVIKPLSKYRSALVLMTNSSANSPRTADLLRRYGQHVRLHVPLGLAEAIEYNNTDQVKKCIHKIKDLAQKHQVTAIGLSCTHYPLILQDLQTAMPKVKFINPSGAVVAQVLRVLRLTQHE